MGDEEDQALLQQSVDEAKQRETDFWDRMGFPDFDVSKSPAFYTYKSTVKDMSLAYRSPMARRMFMLGYMKAEKILEEAFDNERLDRAERSE